MSKLSVELTKVCNELGGATLTKKARDFTVKQIFKTLRDNEIRVVCLADLKIRHVEKYIELAQAEHLAKTGEPLSKRTLQNRISLLRKSLRALKRDKFADHERMTSKALGIDGASRAGSHVAMTAEQFAEVSARVYASGKPGHIAVFDLQRTLGLRANEAVNAGKSLKTWSKQLERDISRLSVVHGTKGGRLRESTPLEGINEAVKAALAAADPVTGYIIQSSSPEAANRSYARFCHAMGMKGEISSHSLRYTYAQTLKAQALTNGFEEKEALALVSMELGHGDGRGTYIKQVYAQK